MYVYQQSESQLWTVGYHAGDEWIPESDHDNESDARNRVIALNGGTPPATTHPTSDPKPIKQQIPGLTKREYFAAMAMQGIVSRQAYDPADIASFAVDYADALIEHLQKSSESFSPE